jgi:sulfate permease, SulP family
MITVFLLTVFVDLIMAVGVGITISSIIAVYQVSKNTQIKTSRSRVSFDIDIGNPDIEIIMVNGSLFFGTASALDNRLEKVKNSKKIIIDCKNVSFLDISAIFTLEEIISKFKSKELEIILVLKYRHKRKVLAVDTSNVFKKIKIYHNLDDAINYTQKYEMINNG